MRRVLFVATAAGALLAPPASAHVTTRPAGIEADAPATVTLEVPNERDEGTTTRLVLTVPERVEIEAAEAPAGWTVTHDDERATWTGGAIGGNDLVEFTVKLLAHGPAGSVALDVRQGYDDRTEAAWTTPFTILPAGDAAPKQQLGRALVASVVGVFVVAGSLALLRRNRRGDPA